MSLIGFEDGKAFIELNNMECVRIYQHMGLWNIEATVRDDAGEKQDYMMYTSANESDARKHFDSLISKIPSAIIIKETSDN